MKRLCFAFAMLLMAVCLQAQTVSDVTFTPRYPWNGLVDIRFRIDGGLEASKTYSVHFIGYDQDRNQTVEIQTITGQTKGFTEAGQYAVVWDTGVDCPEFAAKDFRIQAQLRAIEPRVQGDPNSTYLVIDLSGGSNADSYPCRYTDTAPKLSNDTCRTTELWLRRIPAGTFLMGSPEDELGRFDNEPQHQVTLTQDYYIGVFEVTQKQYELVMGSNPSRYKGDTRPVAQVSYSDLRGTSAEGGAGWPENGYAVDTDSFFGVLRAKTGLLFDLPTEAQWEYACRAGTTTALNSGKNLTANVECPNMAEVGRYRYNYEDGKGGFSAHTKVGCYLPNAWGLYDMHGNVCEWCLDWYGVYPTEAVADPVGAISGTCQVVRGGRWDIGGRHLMDDGGIVATNNCAMYCRSAYRDNYGYNPLYRNYDVGFRVVCLP